MVMVGVIVVVDLVVVVGGEWGGIVRFGGEVRFGCIGEVR